MNNLEVTEAHRTIASIPWRQIITTNYDLLIEKAFDKIRGTSENVKDIVPVRSIQEYNNLTEINEIKYIKLHGCMSDNSKYPFVFSTKDYSKVKKFYRSVLNSLKSPSDKIKIVSIGYSFEDTFAYSFLKTLDSENYRDRRWLYNVDPFVNENMLDYYNEQKIAIIKTSCESFFKKYREWEENRYGNKRRMIKSSIIKNRNNKPLTISNKLSFKLDLSLKQLSDSYKSNTITEKDFLLGEEPSYEIVLKNFDVIKDELISNLKQHIFSNVNNDKSSLIPIFCLTGEFGTGKTTYTYRLIKSIVDDPDYDSIAFEITDFENIRTPDYIDLINQADTQNILFYTNNIEVDSVFKGLLKLRAEISMRQISSTNIIFLTSVRNNILTRYKTKLDYRNLFEYPIPTKLTKEEVDEFLTKLNRNNLVEYRDIEEKNKLIYKVTTEYNSDAFISLVELVSQGKHINNLRDAYFQLSSDCRKAFIYTTLLYRFNILMPSNLLKQLISKDWEDFKTNIIEVEGKGILIQEEVKAIDLDPDLYFRTKHPIIADLLIQEILKTKDKIFDNYLSIIRKATLTQRMSKLVINLLKSITTRDEISYEKIYRLYDAAYDNFQEDPFFILNYSINLQKRGRKNDLEKALSLLVYAEGLLDRRNDKFIHRRGVITFDLAKLYYKEEKNELNLCLKYIDEAEELFELKQVLDPFSSFSYVDYLKLLIWDLDNINFDKEAELSLKLKIEELYEIAVTSVSEGLSKINEIYARYKEKHHSQLNSLDYLRELDDMYTRESTRPYACILRYKYYEERNDGEEKRESLLQEMENYIYNNDVSKFLFRYYSARLNTTKYRIKFFDLTKSVNKLKDFKTLSYNYYMYVAESYNGNYAYAFSYIKNIDRTYSFINPDFQQIWKESDNEENRIFEGVIIKHTKGYYMFKAYDLQSKFILKKNIRRNFIDGEKAKAYLHFYYNGIRAEILNEEDSIFEE